MEKTKSTKYYPWFLCFITVIVEYAAIGTCSSSFGMHMPFFLLSNTLSTSINSFKTVVCMLLIWFFVTDSPADKGMEPLGGKVVQSTESKNFAKNGGNGSKYAPTTL